MPKSKRTIKVQLSTDVNVATQDSPDATRKFSGVAHSGKPFRHHGVMNIVELSSITNQPKLPVLLLHDRAKRAGFGALDSKEKLNISGYLLSNEHGTAIAQDADDGFPWQLSAHLESQTVDELAHGETETVNGQTVTGPMLILRNSVCYEVSFTPTGVDSDTYAMVLSDDGIYGAVTTTPQPTNNPFKKDTDMTPEEIAALKKQLADLQDKVDALEKSNSDLQKANEGMEEAAKELEEAAKEAVIDAQLSQAGFVKTEDGKGYQGISTGTRNMLLSASVEDAKSMIGDLNKPTRDDIPDYLLSEQHKPNGTGKDVKLSSNPMLADAAARATEQKNYV